MEKQIFEKCLKMHLPVHNFRNGTRAIFYKGFKFEEVTDTNGKITYNCYNIRYMSYKKLTDDEFAMIIDKGVLVSADVLSYQNYQKIISSHTNTINNPNNGYKSVEKAKRCVEQYEKVCNSLKSLHKKHSELFV